MGAIHISESRVGIGLRAVSPNNYGGKGNWLSIRKVPVTFGEKN